MFNFLKKLFGLTKEEVSSSVPLTPHKFAELELTVNEQESLNAVEAAVDSADVKVVAKKAKTRAKKAVTKAKIVDKTATKKPAPRSRKPKAQK